MNRVPPIIDPIAVGSTALPLLVFDANTGQYAPGAASSVAAPGSDTWVIFNDGGFFGADAGLSYDKTNNRLSINGGASGQAAYLGMTVNAGARGIITKNATTDLSGYAFIHYGSSDEPYCYLMASGSWRSPYVGPKFPVYDGFSYGRLDFQTSGEAKLQLDHGSGFESMFAIISSGRKSRFFYDASNYCDLAVSSAGDATITPSGGDLAIVSNLTVSGNAPGRLLQTQKLTSGSGATFTPHAAATKWRVRAWGGGGGGGGVDGTAGRCGAAGGGASGAKFEQWFSALATPTYTVVNTGGAGGAAAAGTGTAGSDSVFVANGTTYTAKGGLGGVGSTAGSGVANVAGGAGQLSTGADMNGSGAPGANGYTLSTSVGASGAGGSTEFGGGGVGKSTASAVGAAATGYGGGGGGAISNDATDRAGGDGAPGVIIVEEYA